MSTEPREDNDPSSYVCQLKVTSVKVESTDSLSPLTSIGGALAGVMGCGAEFVFPGASCLIGIRFFGATVTVSLPLFMHRSNSF